MSSQESTLLALPIEIRLQIYQHLFIGRTVCTDAFHHESTKAGTTIPPTSPLNILLTCRQLHIEALPIFYSLVRFCFQRHNIYDDGSPAKDIESCFPLYEVTLTPDTTHPPLRSTRLVQQIYYAGTDPHFIRNLNVTFPALKSFEFDLGWDHVGADQTNFDHAMRRLIRHRDWRNAMKDALDQRFSGGMARAVFEIQKLGPTRGFRFVLHWVLAWRFIDFVGECDLDEWILHVKDPAPDGSKNVYDIKQEPLFYEMS